MNRALYRFDLSAIPAGVQVTSATFGVHVLWNDKNTTVSVHEVLATWSEATVTQANFGDVSSWSPTPVATFLAGGVGMKTVDVTSLAASWVSGSKPNHGVLLEEPAVATHAFWTKDVSSTSLRPKLDVCYVQDLCGGVTCAASDACHVAGTCDPATGQCSNPAAADGTACSDGNACTQSDTCQAGTCTGANPVACAASDACHVAGTCDPATGQCSNPAAADGTACSDGNACTQSDTCQAGTCTGADAVTCAASDQCHVAGTCNPATGQCSNPIAANGTACSDGDACTQSDTCQAGACTGTNPVACAASDACHVAGTCDPATGQCSNPIAANGKVCDDGNACTQSDTCQAGTCTGTNPVACAASDACHVAGTCDPATGQCSNPAAADGTACSDGNACTQSDTCQAGTCTGAEAVTCAASDQCHVAGTCNPATGQCSNPIAANGTACNDGDACTQSDTCQAGACTGADPVACAASDQCHVAGTCDPATGQCSNPAAADGTACDDGNACTQSDTCQAGACSSGAAVVCAALNACHLPGVCDAATGQCSNPTAANGAACDDGNAGTEFDTCQAGTCTGANSVVITVQSPQNNSVSSASSIVVTGSISEPATVKVGAVNAAVNGLSFSATVQLHEGNNILPLQAVGAAGNPGSASLVVIHDATPPHVTITAPANNAVVAGNTITVTGTVHDLLIGTVNPGDCTVTVNGVPAVVENSGYRAVNVPVATGTGTITAVAKDIAGNVASAVISITGDMTSNAMIFAAGGDGQSSAVGTTLAQPFTALVADNAGVGVAGVPVTFKVTRSNGTLANGERTETVVSNAQGFASTTLTLGNGAGAASDQVVATAAAFLGAATFAADGVVDPAGQRVLTVSSGGTQRGAVNTLAPQPVGVFLADDAGNPVTGQPVTFTVKEGGGRVNGASSVTTTTDTDGRTFVLFTLGPAAGEGSQLVEATSPGANTLQFVASTEIAGPPADTDLSGVVLTNENDPIVNVHVSIKGTQLGVLTDAEGHFLLTGVPVGPIHLEIHGGTAGPYPTLTFDLEMVSGIENVMDRPIYLATMDSDGMGTANPTTDLVLRRQDTPGLVFTVPAGSATFATANGPSDTGTVQVIRVNNDKIPMLPSNGAIPTLAFAIMPHGATFDPPAPIQFPNVDGRPAGEVVQIYSYDHDLATFVVVGTAQVSEDGTEIVSEAGQGIVKGGWHYVPPKPPSPGSVCTSSKCRVVFCLDASCFTVLPDGKRRFEYGKTCAGTNFQCWEGTSDAKFFTGIVTHDLIDAPDASCYSSQTCSSGGSCDPEKKAAGSSCTRGRDNANGWSGHKGECLDTAYYLGGPNFDYTTQPRICCPDALICNQTGKNCPNGYDGKVCCSGTCSNGCCGSN